LQPNESDGPQLQAQVQCTCRSLEVPSGCCRVEQRQLQLFVGTNDEHQHEKISRKNAVKLGFVWAQYYKFRLTSGSNF